MERGGGSDQRNGFGSVKAAIDFYRERIPKENSQTSSSETPSSRMGELHQVRKSAWRFSETKKLADSVKSQAESELSYAKKKVNELTKKIEESNSRVKVQVDDLEKMKTTRREEGDWGEAGDYQDNKVMEQLKNVKQELSKLKMDMASLSEEKRRAEKEREASMSKAEACADSVEALTKEIENLNEEHVLVELARLEAAKEREAIEAQRQKAAEEHSAKLEETRKQITDIIQEFERVKALETRLAITTSDANVLESELQEVRKMDGRIGRNENLQQAGKTDSSFSLQLVTKEIEAAKKELESRKTEGFQLMASMDISRKELNSITEERARLSRKEAKTDVTIQNLNSKLLRAKAKLESASAAEQKTQLVVSNLSTTLEQLKSQTEAAEKERISSLEDTTVAKAQVQKTESEIDLAEERFQTALQELQTAKLSEAKILENLKMLTKKTMQNRASASQRSSTITISTFEYEYLKGCAVRAAEIADKKVAAAQAWVEALQASEKEILMKIEYSHKQNRKLRAKEKQEVSKTQQSLSAKRMVERKFENWRKKFEDITEHENFKPQLRQARRSMTGIRFAPTGRARFRTSASPATRRTPRSVSFSINRTKVIPNLAKFLSGKSIEANL